MANKIDREIVQMVFETKDFQKGIADSIDDIETLKKSFDLTKAQESFGELEKASNVDFAPMAKSLDAINSKISFMGVVAATMISNVTTSIMEAGKNLANTLVLTPIITGLEEYETQLNAVQTILANTKRHGTTLEDVTAALDELNTYADLTIYNFTQMTDSIGKFTTAGVDLETSVSAIKGIANAAALSGSNAQQASTAMYQLSQAISSGTVRLQDWISVENAGMGGEIFRESLVETARVHGVAIDTILEQAGGFRNSLQEKWLTSDIMLETLQKFTGDLTEAQLETMGYTEQQIAGILEMGQMANDAATKIKTLTQLKDTMAEAMQSGWGQTWRIIFGDFEQAKSLWGAVAERFGAIIDGSSQSRNSMLEMWAEMNGRTAGIAAFFNIFDSAKEILTAVGSGFRDVFDPITGLDLSLITHDIFFFSKTLLESIKENLAPITSIARGIASGLDILRMVVVAIAEPILELAGSVLPGATGGFIEWLAALGDSIFEFRNFAEETDFFRNIVASIIAGVGEFADKLDELISPLAELGLIKDVIQWFEGLSNVDLAEVWSGILSAAQVAVAPFYILIVATKELYRWLSELKVIEDIVAYFKGISWEGIKSSFKGISDNVTSLVDTIKDSDLLEKFLGYFDTFDGRRFEQFTVDAKEWIGSIGGIISGVTSKMQTLNKEADDTGENVSELGTKIGEGLEKALEGLTEAAEKIDYSRLFDILNTGILAGIALSIRKLATGGLFENIFPEDVAEGLSGIFESLEGSLTSFQTNLKADALQKVAVAIAMLAASIALMTLIDSSKLLAASAAIAAMIAMLFGSAGALGLIKTQDAVKASVAIVGLSLSLAIVAAALSSVSDLKPSQLEASLAAMAAGLAGLVVAIAAISGKGDGQLIKTVGLMLGLGLALKLLVGVIAKFGSMKPDVLAQGLKAISAALGILVTSMVAITKFSESGLAIAAFAIVEMAGALNILAAAVRKFGQMDSDELNKGLQATGIVLGGFALMSRLLDPKGLISAGVGITIMTASLLIMVQALDKFSAFSWKELQVGLVGMGASLLILVIAANAMSGALAGAAAMIVMASAILIISAALKILSTLSWKELAIGLAGLAAVFVILGLAGLLLAPLIPVILLLGVGMLLMGVAAALLGVGLLAAASGLVAIAGSAALIAAGIGIVGKAIIDILPSLGEAVAEALVNLLQTIAENTPLIVEAMNAIILGMIEGLVGLIPEIVIAMMKMLDALLTAVVERLPDLIQQGYDILLAFLKGIADNIADIVETGYKIVTEIINGIAEALPDLIDSAFNLILTFLNAMADAIEEYMPQIIAAGFRIGTAMIEGIVNGLWDGIDILKAAIAELIQEAIDRFKASLGIKSPSTVTYDMGVMMILGLVNAVKDKADMFKEALEEFSEKAQNGIKPLLEALFDAIDEDIEFAPVIRPVLDLNQFSADVGRMNNTFDNTGVLASLSYAPAPYSGRETEKNGQSSQSGGITYNQYNYSPKALDRAAIYRATKTQIAVAAMRERFG